MGRIAKSIADMLLPLSAPRLRSRRPPPVAENPAIQVVWEVVGMIPRGKVSTYGAVARAAGLPGRARMAGRALKIAPDKMNLPWHRVVGAGGRIVFPKTSPHFREQCRRLRAERVVVKDGRVNGAHMTDLEAP